MFRRGRYGKHVCIVVQNLPVPFDRRVWLECRALRAAGYEVSVVCPKAEGDPAYARAGGRASLQVPARSRRSPGRSCSSPSTRGRSWPRSSTSSEPGGAAPFGVVQVCNPPDVLWAAAFCRSSCSSACAWSSTSTTCAPSCTSRGSADGARLPYRALLLTERATYGLAAACHRHERVVPPGRPAARPQAGRRHHRSCAPARTRTACGAASRSRRCAAGTSTCWSTSASWARRTVSTSRCARCATSCTSAGATDVGAHPDRRRRRRRRRCVGSPIELDLGDHVEFTGRAPDERRHAAHVHRGQSACRPDPKNPLNDVSTMNKTMEYMAYELPVVAFDLVETRVSAQEAAVYATPNQVDEYARPRAGAARRRRQAQADGGGGPPPGRGRPRLAAPDRPLPRASTTGCSAS